MRTRETEAVGFYPKAIAYTQHLDVSRSVLRVVQEINDDVPSLVGLALAPINFKYLSP